MSHIFKLTLSLITVITGGTAFASQVCTLREGRTWEYLTVYPYEESGRLAAVWHMRVCGTERHDAEDYAVVQGWTTQWYIAEFENYPSVEYIPVDYPKWDEKWLMRQDEDKVYLRLPDNGLFEDKEYLIYDFGAGPGDSYLTFVACGHCEVPSYGCPVMLRVGETELTEVDGESCRKIRIDGLGYANHDLLGLDDKPIYMIEGIGAVNGGILPFFEFKWSMAINWPVPSCLLRVFNQDGEVIYTSPNEDIPDLTEIVGVESVNDSSHQEVKITNTSIYAIDSGITTLSLRGLNGILIESVTGQDPVIYTDTIQHGVYIVTYTHANGCSKSIKFVI